MNMKKASATSTPAPAATVRAARPPARRSVALRPVASKPGVSLVSQVVDALRRAILAAQGPGVFLGSEGHLMSALGVSRPTFRQAAKLLRHENLLSIKRGVGGGFFTQAPSGEAVSRTAASYLNALGASMRQLNDVVGPLQAEAARLLARNPDRAVRARLAELLARHAQPGHASLSEAERHPVRRILAFERLLIELADNAAIELVMRVMRDLARDARHDFLKLTPDRVETYARFQQRLAQAVLEGDEAQAGALCEQFTDDVRGWLSDGAKTASAG